MDFKNELKESFVMCLPIFVLVAGALLFIFVVTLPMDCISARAKSRMIEQTTGQKIDPWDIMWGGDPPTQDIQVRTRREVIK